MPKTTEMIVKQQAAWSWVDKFEKLPKANCQMLATEAVLKNKPRMLLQTESLRQKRTEPRVMVFCIF